MKRSVRYIATAMVVALIALVIAALPAVADPGTGKGSDHASDNSKVAEVAAAEEAAAAASSNADHSDGTAGTSGDVNEPQPRSNADNNGGGANHEGPYDSTRDGSPSMNGNGGGKATGKPCAGCVGKADNKNPQGQYPNGSDHNNGYECDGNNGIGKTNPAHTGCTEEPPPCEDDPNTAEDECNPDEPCVDDQNTPDDDCNPTPPEDDEDEVLPDRLDRPSTPDDEVLPDRLDRPGVRAAILPFTGGSVLDMTILAIALMATGAVLLGLRKVRGDNA